MVDPIVYRQVMNDSPAWAYQAQGITEYLRGGEAMLGGAAIVDEIVLAPHRARYGHIEIDDVRGFLVRIKVDSLYRAEAQ